MADSDIKRYIGIDIGGTKCAVSLGFDHGGGETPEIAGKRKFSTGGLKPYSALVEFLKNLNELLDENDLEYRDISGIGVSCGSPLDSKRGLILSPPNLPGWDGIKVVEFFENATDIKTHLQNDANACAVAEWKYGAGRGYENVVFLTFGTGFGAGLIINGRLYSGAHDNAGEIGHIRLTDDGPLGYYKHGSAEGWCSGGGIAQIGQAAVKRELERGVTPRLLTEAGSEENITAKLIGDLAEKDNDPLCLDIYRVAGEKLGAALSIIMDLIDPEIVVMGGIYMRSAPLLTRHFDAVIERETLSRCPIVPAGLGERVGDYAALSVAALYD